MAERSPQFSEEVNTSSSSDGERRSIFLFNCDGTYNLDVLETFLNQVKSKLHFEFSINKIYFPLSQMSEMCSSKIPDRKIDMAFFVVHASESRLSINEDNAGIGYAKVYRALLQATEGKVIVVIGGDDNYKNESEEDGAVISRWARRKISSQFSEETLDGRKSFVFSWDKNHRPIHEAALLHYFDPGKVGNKFEYQRPARLESPPGKVEEKGHEIVGLQTASDAADLSSCSLTNKGYPKMETSENEETESEPWSLLTHEEAKEAISKDLAVLCRDTSVADDVKNLFRILDLRPDVLVGCPGLECKRYLENNSLKVCIITMDETMYSTRSEEWSDVLRTAQRRVINKVIVIICSDKRNTGPPTSKGTEVRITETIRDALGDKGLTFWWKGGTCHPTKDPVINRMVSVEDALAESSDLAILCRDTSVADDVKNLFRVLDLRPDVLVGCPGLECKRYLENNSLKVCIIMMDETMYSTRSEEWSDVLRTAQRRVINKVIVIICSDKRNTGPPTSKGTEVRITETIRDALGDKGLTFWWKGGTCLPTNDPVINPTVSLEDALAESSGKPNVSGPLGKELSQEGTTSKMPNETLLLETLLINGKISYDEKDIKLRKENWSPPKEIVSDLLEKWKRTTRAELCIYLINNEPNKLEYRVSVNEIHAQSSNSWSDVLVSWMVD